MKCETIYSDRPGAANTGPIIEAALKRAAELNIDHIVVASCSGRTAMMLREKAKGTRIVCVTHQAGFREPGKCEMPDGTRDELTAAGVRVYTGTHFFGGAGRAVRMKFGGLEVDELCANTLRILGQGVKVCVEITIMALDAGLIPHGREVIAIAGSGSGADTAIVCLPAHGKDLFDFEVREIIGKPRTHQ